MIVDYHMHLRGPGAGPEETITVFDGREARQEPLG